MILTLDELVAQRADWRREAKTVVWTNGCFDLLHVGHVRSLHQARQLGDVLVVGLNDDASVRALKGDGRPLSPADERAEILDALRVVDAVTVFSERVPTEIVRRLEPDVYCKGEDYRGRPVPEAEVVSAYGGRVVFLTYSPGHSTTDMIRRAVPGPSGPPLGG